MVEIPPPRRLRASTSREHLELASSQHLDRGGGTQSRRDAIARLFETIDRYDSKFQGKEIYGSARRPRTGQDRGGLDVLETWYESGVKVTRAREATPGRWRLARRPLGPGWRARLHGHSVLRIHHH